MKQDWIPAQAPDRSTAARGAPLLCQLQPSGAEAPPTGGESRVASRRALSAGRLHRQRVGCDRIPLQHASPTGKIAPNTPGIRGMSAKIKIIGDEPHATPEKCEPS